MVVDLLDFLCKARGAHTQIFLHFLILSTTADKNILTI